MNTTVEENSIILSLKERIKTLSQQIGGYKTSNQHWRNKADALTKQVLTLEGKLRIELKKNEECDAKNSEQIHQFYRERELMRIKIARLEASKNELEQTVAGLSEELKVFKALPWYKKIFVK